MLRGIVPIVFVPFREDGQVDEISLRRVVRFELEGGANGLGINGFASEAYKLTDQERLLTAAVVADEVAGQVPLVIGLAAGSLEAAKSQVRLLSRHSPAAFMVLPPSTMNNGPRALVKHYLDLAAFSPFPLMVQQSPHIPQYAHTLLSAEDLSEMAHSSEMIRYFKIEGAGAPERMKALQALVPGRAAQFGGVGGLTFLDELQIGAAGVIPGAGFNEVFHQAWAAWESGNKHKVTEILSHYQHLVQAVSSRGHEFSLHARKALLLRAGLIASAYVRTPTVEVTPKDIAAVFAAADRYALRVSRTEP